MGDGDPVGQQQFFEVMGGTERRILEAVEKVNGHTQDLRVDVGKVQTSLDTHEKRMDGLDDKIKDQKIWNRGLAAIEVTLAGLLAYLGIRGD